MVEFGEQLRKAREEKGMTQQSLAEQLYVSRQSVSHWECGDRYPDLVTAKKISQVLDVSLDDLLSGKEMIKVVERNPVVENKTINNLTIALLALIALSYFWKIAWRAMFWYVDKDSSFFSEWSVALGPMILVIVFSYGLYHAVRDTLTPKHIGVILITYFAIELIIDGGFYLSNIGSSITEIKEYSRGADKQYLIKSFLGFQLRGVLTVFLPYILGIVASFFHFIRKGMRKLWVNMIIIAASIKIIDSIYLFVIRIANQKFEVANSSNVEYFVVDYVIKESVAQAILDIALCILIIYQVITLYRKRRNAFDLSGEKEIAEATT